MQACTHRSPPPLAPAPPTPPPAPTPPAPPASQVITCGLVTCFSWCGSESQDDEVLWSPRRLLWAALWPWRVEGDWRCTSTLGRTRLISRWLSARRYSGPALLHCATLGYTALHHTAPLPTPPHRSVLHCSAPRGTTQHCSTAPSSPIHCTTPGQAVRRFYRGEIKIF